MGDDRPLPPPGRLAHPLWNILAWAGVLLVAGLLAGTWRTGQHAMAGAMAIFLAATLALVTLVPRLPGALRLLLVVSALLNGAGGAFGWFDAFAWFDELVHGYTGFAGLFAIGYLYARDDAARRPRLPGWCAAMGLALGVGWEIIEGIGGELGFWDTVTDIVMDVVGAAFGGLAARHALRAAPSSAGAPRRR